MSLQCLMMAALSMTLAGYAQALKVAQQTRESANSTSRCAHIAYVRIQKTGGTSFGKAIGPEMAIRNQQTFNGKQHLDFEGASATGADCLVATLRDPVDRFMSEWDMLHSPAHHLMFQDQWDVREQDLDWLHRIQGSSANNDTALLEYLHAPQSPTRNRQTLYLLGFDRVQCRSGDPSHMGLLDARQAGCCGICSHNEPYGYPALAYDWERDHDDLLARAKQRLLELRGFGVADCYESSMKAMARSLSWDPDETTYLAKNIHLRDRKHSAARQYVPAGIAEQIRKANDIDDKLVAFAKQLMFDNHGIRCDG